MYDSGSYDSEDSKTGGFDQGTPKQIRWFANQSKDGCHWQESASVQHIKTAKILGLQELQRSTLQSHKGHNKDHMLRATQDILEQRFIFAGRGQPLARDQSFRTGTDTSKEMLFHQFSYLSESGQILLRDTHVKVHGVLRSRATNRYSRWDGSGLKMKVLITHVQL